MFRFLMIALFLAAASAFMVQGPMPTHAVRAASPVAQFGTGNTDGNGFDEKGNANFFLSPIAGGSKDYPYGQYELDTSGELPAKFFAFLAAVGLPAAFAYGIWNA